MTNVDEISFQNKYSENISVSESNPESGNEQKKQPAVAKECSLWDGCNAPICPADKESLHSAIWYPTEGFCTSYAFCKLPWIRNQRKLARKVRNKDFYYTLEMLSHNCVITVATEGLNPDTTDYQDKTALKKWLKQHPKKREVSEEERENRRKMFNANVLSRIPAEKDATTPETEQKEGKPPYESSKTILSNDIVPLEGINPLNT